MLTPEATKRFRCAVETQKRIKQNLIELGEKAGYAPLDLLLGGINLKYRAIDSQTYFETQETLYGNITTFIPTYFSGTHHQYTENIRAQEFTQIVYTTLDHLPYSFKEAGCPHLETDSPTTPIDWNAIKCEELSSPAETELCQAIQRKLDENPTTPFITATSDTYLKLSTQDSSRLPENGKCLVSEGTKINYGTISDSNSHWALELPQVPEHCPQEIQEAQKVFIFKSHASQ